MIKLLDNEKVSDNLMDSCEKILSDLVFFLIDTETDDDPLMTKGIPIAGNQMLMKEQMLITTIIQLLCAPFKSICTLQVVAVLLSLS